MLQARSDPPSEELSHEPPRSNAHAWATGRARSIPRGPDP